jgi:energy-coupling factor transporter transmembrane protein EcfT
MHAEVKIISFLIFGAAMSFGDAEELIMGTIVLVLAYGLFARHSVASAMRILMRMRWFFLSIAIVYGFFSPGRLLFPQIAWGPTYEGLLQGGHRIGGLVMIVFAVNLLLRTTPQAALISGVLWCLHPLSWLGVPHERLAVRIALILDVVRQVQDLYRHGRRDPEVPTGLRQRLMGMGAATNRLFQSVHDKAETEPLQTIALPERAAIPLWQWGVPLALSAVFFGLNW